MEPSQVTQFIRIALRYIVGFFAAKAYITAAEAQQIASDPDVIALVEVGVSAAAALAIETWYGLAKRFGWPT